MLGWVVTFLIIGLIAAVFGFGGIAGASFAAVKIIFFVGPSTAADLRRLRHDGRPGAALVRLGAVMSKLLRKSRYRESATSAIGPKPTCRIDQRPLSGVKRSLIRASPITTCASSRSPSIEKFRGTGFGDVS